jgi:holin-like protein
LLVGQHRPLGGDGKAGAGAESSIMIPALATLLAFQLLGEALVFALDAPVPGPVVGLALLLLTLVLRPSVLTGVKPTAQTLLQHLSLLFVPAGVGVMVHLQRIGDEALAIGVALVISTWVGLAAAALTMTWLVKRTSTPPPAKKGAA